MQPAGQSQAPPPHTDRVIITDTAPSCLRQLRGGVLSEKRRIALGKVGFAQSASRNTAERK